MEADSAEDSDVGAVGPAVAIPEPWYITDLRKTAAGVAAGFVGGFVVLGWVNRLFMMLLARLNPEATGRVSDDGFRIGQFTEETAGLLIIGTLIGVVGGLLYLAVRDLRVGPKWFQTLSMTGGPAVVVGSMLIHSDGVDFQILEPTWLPIALFILLPGLYAYIVMTLTDHWLRDESWFMSGSNKRAIAAGSVLVLGPVLLFIGGGFVFRALYQGVPSVQEMVNPRLVSNAARAVLTAIFLVSLFGLGGTVNELL